MTIKEIADLAGVSVASVSRTINHKGKVSPQVQQRILNIINQYNYTPDAKGRFLRTNRTKMILVPLSDFTNTFVSHLVFGIQSIAKEYDYDILMIPMDIKSSSDEDKCFAMLADKRVDGMIATFTRKSHEELAALNHKYPFVLLSECPDFPEITGVCTNNLQAGYNVVQHFLSCGHQKIAMLSLPDIFPTSKWRQTGYKKAMSEANLSSHIVFCGYHIPDGYNGCQKLMESENAPTAIFCYNDSLAIGAVRYLVEHGLQPGADVDIIGFDDLPFAKNFIPSISSVHHPAIDMGRKAFELLMDRIEDLETPPKLVTFPSQLILRDTTKRCAIPQTMGPENVNAATFK